EKGGPEKSPTADKLQKLRKAKYQNADAQWRYLLGLQDQAFSRDEAMFVMQFRDAGRELIDAGFKSGRKDNGALLERILGDVKPVENYFKERFEKRAKNGEYNHQHIHGFRLDIECRILQEKVKDDQADPQLRKLRKEKYESAAKLWCWLTRTDV